jgi:hypothetical protein
MLVRLPSESDGWHGFRGDSIAQAEIWNAANQVTQAGGPVARFSCSAASDSAGGHRQVLAKANENRQVRRCALSP